MSKLYLFMGAPGAGKTTVAKKIAELCHAKHLWADVERHKLFSKPTHSQAESDELYAKLNAATDYLLEQDKDVVFDTNFNHFADREKLREIASRHNAETIIIWITTPIEVARKRALHSKILRNGYDYHMNETQFSDITGKFEPPRKDETVIKIDGTDIDEARLKQLLGL